MTQAGTFDDVAQVLASARAERTSERARHFFKVALGMCDSSYEITRSTQALILKAHTYGELALEATTPAERTAFWRKALTTVDPSGPSGEPELASASDLAKASSAIAVDCFQDVFSDLDFRARQTFLRSARDRIDAVLGKTADTSTIGELLARKSSVLRHLALGELTPQGRVRRLDESQRCASRGVQQVRSWSTVLELGLSEWALARHEASDEEYAIRLRRAEEYLSDPILESYEAAQLALARFYRLTFQSLKACHAFPRERAKGSSYRRILRDSYILGEAATQLWFADYPEELVAAHLADAQSLLESAIAAGYCNARIIVALAYVAAIKGGVEQGSTVLADICTKADVAWDRAVKLALDASPANLFEFGFALGIDQSAVWTRLGTFASRFLGDQELAEGLYRAATRLDPHDAIALTNLARFLVRHRLTSGSQEARRLIQKAQNFADRRFIWWRAVLAELERSTRVPSGPTLKVTRELREHFKDLKDLKREFRRVEGLGGQQRGYELERLVFELSRLTVGTAAPPYRIERVGGGISQIDGYFEHGTDKYRVECKWLSTPADHNDIIAFADKIDVAGVGGLFISMSGFTESAIGRTREQRGQKAILLMDGTEVRTVFSLQLNFDDVMARKRQYFDQCSEPYHRVVLGAEAA